MRRAVLVAILVALAIASPAGARRRADALEHQNIAALVSQNPQCINAYVSTVDDAYWMAEPNGDERCEHPMERPVVFRADGEHPRVAYSGPFRYCSVGSVPDAVAVDLEICRRPPPGYVKCPLREPDGAGVYAMLRRSPATCADARRVLRAWRRDYSARRVVGWRCVVVKRMEAGGSTRCSRGARAVRFDYGD